MLVYKNLKIDLTDPLTNFKYHRGHNDSAGKFYKTPHDTPFQDGELIVACQITRPKSYYRDGNIFVEHFHIIRPVAYCFDGDLLKVTELLTRTEVVEC